MGQLRKETDETALCSLPSTLLRQVLMAKLRDEKTVRDALDQTPEIVSEALSDFMYAGRLSAENPMQPILLPMPVVAARAPLG